MLGWPRPAHVQATQEARPRRLQTVHPSTVAAAWLTSRHALGGATDSSSSFTPSAVIRSIIQLVRSSSRRSSVRDVVRYFTVLTSLVTLSTRTPSLPRYFQLCLVYRKPIHKKADKAGRSRRSTHQSSSENMNTPRSDWEQTKIRQRSGEGCDAKQTAPQTVSTQQAVYITYPRRMSQEKSLRRLCELVPRHGIRHDGVSGQGQQLVARCPLKDAGKRREVGGQQSEAT